MLSSMKLPPDPKHALSGVPQVSVFLFTLYINELADLQFTEVAYADDLLLYESTTDSA